MGFQLVRRLSVFVSAVSLAVVCVIPIALLAQNATHGAIQTPGGGRGPGAAPDANDPANANADLSPKARDLAAELRKCWNVEFDDASAIGRRYRRQDEIGTPFCVTVDFDSLDDRAVTVRDRDTMSQERVPLEVLHAYLAERLKGA